MRSLIVSTVTAVLATAIGFSAAYTDYRYEFFGKKAFLVLALLPPGLDLRPAPDEVEAVFQLPLAVLLDPDAPERRRAEFRGRLRDFWVWPHPEHYVWGATAAILVHLAHRLRGGKEAAAA